MFDPWPCSVGEGSGVAMSCDIGCRRGLDPTLHMAPIQPLALELPCAVGAALKRRKKNSKRIYKILGVYKCNRYLYKYRIVNINPMLLILERI